MNQNSETPKVMFENEGFQRSSLSFRAPTPKIVQLVIKYSGGYIKDEGQANKVLILFIIVTIIISLYLFFGTAGGNTSQSKAARDQMLKLHPDLIKL